MESTAAWVLFANRIFSQIHETAAPSHHQLSLVRPRKKKGARRRVVKPVAGCCLVGVGPPLTLMVPWKLRLFTGTIRRLRSHQVIAECLAPFLKLGCAIAVKRWVLGPTTPGRRDRSESLVPTTETLARLDSYRVVVGVKAPGAHSSHATRHTPRPSLFSLRFRSEWNLLRSWLMARLLPGGRLCGVARLVGTHYDGISTIFRLLGAKVSSERNAPPRLSARQVCRLQCACRSCVVGRRPCACVLRVCRVSCVGPQRAASSLEWRRRAMVPDERPHRARASSKPNGVPQVGKRIYWPGSGLDLTEFDLLEIGDDVTFASRSVYMPSDAHAQAPIKIDAGAMVADRCVLLPGVSVGRNAVLGSGTLAPTGFDFTPGSTWVGARRGTPLRLPGGDEAATAAKPTLRPFGRAFYWSVVPHEPARCATSRDTCATVTSFRGEVLSWWSEQKKRAPPIILLLLLVESTQPNSESFLHVPRHVATVRTISFAVKTLESPPTIRDRRAALFLRLRTFRNLPGASYARRLLLDAPSRRRVIGRLPSWLAVRGHCPLLACACSFGRWQRSRVQAKSEYTH